MWVTCSTCPGFRCTLDVVDDRCRACAAQGGGLAVAWNSTRSPAAPWQPAMLWALRLLLQAYLAALAARPVLVKVSPPPLPPPLPSLAAAAAACAQ